MCRASHDPKARRCNGKCTPRARSARGRARYAYNQATQSPPAPADAQDTVEPTVEPLALRAVSTPEEMRALAATVAAAYAGSERIGDSDRPVDGSAVLRNTSGVDATHGSRLGALRGLGAAVLAEAERAAGITGDEVRVSHEARLADALANGHGVQAARSGLIDGEDPETKADLARLAAGYLAALALIRPMGGTLDTKMPEHPDPDVQAAMHAAAQTYPADWLDASNKRGELHLAQAGRGFYRDNEIYTPEVLQQRQPAPYQLPAGTDPADEYLHEPPRYVATRAPHLDDHEYNEEGWLVQENEFNAGADHPDGDGWERYDDGQKAGWVRPASEYVEAGGPQMVGLLSLSQTPLPQGSTESPYAAVATHELAHRMEHSVPGIGAMEADWLADRTTVDGVRETPAAMGGVYGPGEAAYRDHFVNTYIGRDYDQDLMPGGHEVVSMGWESMMHGRMGGLVGASQRYRNGDDDMRLIVLGILAAAGLPWLAGLDVL